MSVRVRFAPNPSGELHIGSARTALFCWLFASHHGGTFIVRIEDTDPERARPEYIEPILEGLRWLGLEYAEGPDVGGPHGPYRQSERRELHLATIDELLERGAVYRCWCTPQDVKARGSERGYDRHCRTASDPGDGRPYALRFRVPDRAVVFDDVIRGEIRTEAADIQDFVVLRSNGRPNFELANVSDDIAMRITHAIRGEDLISAAVRTTLLYEALGASPPRYAHVPLILDTDRSKLSKRKMATGVHSFRAAGYVSEAMVNYLSLLGWSSPTGDELLSRERLIAEFDLDRVQAHGAVFDRKKLDWMNQEYIKQLSPHDLESRILELHPEAPREVLRRTIDLGILQPRIVTLSEAPGAIRYLHERRHVDASALAEHAGLLAAAADRLEKLEPWTADAIGETLLQLIEERGLNRRKGTKPFYVALSGAPVALPLFESVMLIGRDEALVRLRAAAP